LKQLLEAIRQPSGVHSILTKLLDARRFHPFIIEDADKLVTLTAKTNNNDTD
jgi:hypothetical protein